MAITQKALHQQLSAERTAAREQIASLVRPLDGGRLVEHPEPDGWSVGEVLEHLLRTTEAYEPKMRALFSSARPDAGAPLRDFKPTFIGNILVNSLVGPRKVKTRPEFEPGPSPRSGVLDAFIAGEIAGVAEMERAASLDWCREKIGSPALPFWMPKFNLGDVFRMHSVHVARHVKQVERLVNQLA